MNLNDCITLTGDTETGEIRIGTAQGYRTLNDKQAAFVWAEVVRVGNVALEARTTLTEELKHD